MDPPESDSALCGPLQKGSEPREPGDRDRARSLAARWNGIGLVMLPDRCYGIKLF
jgi:hypothetical protein